MMAHKANLMTPARCFRQVTVKTLGDVFQQAVILSDHYVFRGHADANRPLRTTLEEAAQGVPPENWGKLEQKVIIEFKRRAQYYMSYLPRTREHLEWLALMRHHGCPTRLLDFTRSFFVALFFAIEDTHSDSAVWAVNVAFYEGYRQGPLRSPGVCFAETDDNLSSTYDRTTEQEANSILSSSHEQQCEPGVLLVEPYRMNERLWIQQGVFLFPKNLDASFEENLCACHGVKSLGDLKQKDNGMQVVQKITIPKELHLEIAALLKMMNISAATLFPGLDGYARSQKIHIQLAELSKQRWEDFVTQIRQIDWARITAVSRGKRRKAKKKE